MSNSFSTPHVLYSPPGSSHQWDCPSKNTGVGCHFLLQGLFPTQGSNRGLLCCRRIFYRLSITTVSLVYICHHIIANNWKFFLVIRTFKIKTVLTIVTMKHIRTKGCIYLGIVSLYLLIAFTHFTHPYLWEPLQCSSLLTESGVVKGLPQDYSTGGVLCPDPSPLLLFMVEKSLPEGLALILFFSPRLHPNEWLPLFKKIFVKDSFIICFTSSYHILGVSRFL